MNIDQCIYDTVGFFVSLVDPGRKSIISVGDLN